MNSVRLLYSLFLAAAILYPPQASAEGTISITDVRFSSNKAFTRVVVECSGAIEFSKSILSSPDRLQFDLQRVSSGRFREKDITVNDAAVQSVQVRQDDTSSRVTVTMRSAGEHTVYTLASPDRLVIDITHAVARGQEPSLPRSRVVVIDPGHGGHDPGAIGRRRLKEKDVVLEVARELKKVLETKYGVKVYLTREDDRYLELKERTDVANRRNADLFVSIHANASPNRKVRGIETFFLDIPSNEYDQRIAARENAISVEKMKLSQTEVGMILTGMARDWKRDESVRLAHYVQNALTRNLGMRYKGGVEDHGVKYALFYVLLGADMPSVLIETGFLSNLDDELQLRRPAYRKDLAQSIAKGINVFLTTFPDVTRLALR